MPAVDDLKSLDRLDQVVLGAGVLAFIFSLFHVFTASVSGPGASLIGDLGGQAHASAWHNWGILAMLLILAATGVAAVRIFAPSSLPKMAVGVNLLTLALAGLGFFFLLIAWWHNSKSASLGNGLKIGVHLGIFGYLLLLVSLAQAAAAFLLFKKSGETTPDFKAMNAARTANAGAGTPPVYGGSTPPPPAATYPPATTPAGDYTLDDSTPPPPSV